MFGFFMVIRVSHQGSVAYYYRVIRVISKGLQNLQVASHALEWRKVHALGSNFFIILINLIPNTSAAR